MAKRQVEVFSAGCGACQETIDLINQIACPSCEITVHDMHDAGVAKRAKALGICPFPRRRDPARLSFSRAFPPWG